MADSVLNSRRAFQDLSTANRPGFDVEEIVGRTLATIAVSPQAADAVNQALRSAYGCELPPVARRSTADRLDVLWLGPGLWLAMADAADGERDLERELRTLLGGDVALTDATDAKALLRVSGERARAVLARGLPLDLHSTAFHVGDVASSHAAHVGVTIWLTNETPAFELATPRSSAESLGRWLMEAAHSDAASPL